MTTARTAAVAGCALLVWALVGCAGLPAKRQPAQLMTAAPLDGLEAAAESGAH